jgi:hypothetical protein
MREPAQALRIRTPNVFETPAISSAIRHSRTSRTPGPRLAQPGTDPDRQPRPNTEYDPGDSSRESS